MNVKRTMIEEIQTYIQKSVNIMFLQMLGETVGLYVGDCKVWRKNTMKK